jgi:hypothetical protein
LKPVEEILQMKEPKEVEFYLNYYIMLGKVLDKRGIDLTAHKKEQTQIENHLEELKKALFDNG